MKQVLLTILLIFSVSSEADESCFYPSKKDGGSYSRFNDCGSIKGDKVKLKKTHEENLSYDELGLACVMFSAKDVFYVQNSARTQRVYFYDNDCDYFKEGLTRGIVNDEMVFIDAKLEVVLEPGFELLSHYDYGHSVVCNGPFVEEKHDEHTFLKGGKCGLLNKQGDLVVEAIYRIENREVFQRYINSNNHCPSPPINSEKSALCHAKRHVSNMSHHTDEWKNHEISKLSNKWLVTFVEEGKANEEFTLTLQSDSAQWDSLIKESHNKALQRTSR
jgi:hypothetical protein